MVCKCRMVLRRSAEESFDFMRRFYVNPTLNPRRAHWIELVDTILCHTIFVTPQRGNTQVLLEYFYTLFLIPLDTQRIVPFYCNSIRGGGREWTRKQISSICADEIVPMVCHFQSQPLFAVLFFVSDRKMETLKVEVREESMGTATNEKREWQRIKSAADRC